MNSATRKFRGSFAVNHGVACAPKSGKSSAPTKSEIKVMVAASEKMAEKVKAKGYMPDFV